MVISRIVSFLKGAGGVAFHVSNNPVLDMFLGLSSKTVSHPIVDPLTTNFFGGSVRVDLTLVFSVIMFGPFPKN